MSGAAPIKLADVARLAGVSTATASRVLNAPQLVSEPTRTRVHEAIKELNWIPHGAAKALASLRTRSIGALVATLGHQTIAAMIEAMQKELRDNGYTLLLGRPDPSPERTLQQAVKMIEHGTECLVLWGEDQPPDLMALLERRNVFYVIAYTSGRMGLKNCIGFDNYLETKKLAEHLLALGHRDFALLTRSYEHNDRIRQRIEAVHDTLACAGIAIRPQHFITVPDWGIGSGRLGMRQLLKEPRQPTAIFGANDYLAAGALIEAKASGLSVPRDMSIVGFDDVELAAQLDPPLTTIHVPAERLGHEVAQYIIHCLDGETPPLPERIEAELVIRATTGPPRTGSIAG
jgi:LacI family transcriptional regulator